ncbi:putative E3 ubiquitin-protein ligase RING1b [Chlorella vulgaris]
MTAPTTTQFEAARPPRGLRVALELCSVLEHCRCSICMGIIKNTRAVSACMHRFCKDCIEAWLRTQIENNCPQCRVKFSSKRDCKPDPIFDLLLGTMFGDIEEFEKQMLEPSAEVLEHAMAIGHQIAVVGPPVHCVPALPSDKRHLSSVRDSDAKKLRLGSPGDEDDGGLLQYRGVRFQGDNWQARTKRLGKELSLGLYNTAEEAGMAYDLDRLQQQGGKAQRLNFPLLRQHYKQILSDLTDLHTPDGLLDFLAVAVQAAVKIARSVPGATAPENTGPAAASMLNPRRGIAPAERFSQSWQLAAAALPFGAPAEEDMAVDLESDMDELLSRLDPAHVRPATVQQVPVRHQAKQLADERSLAVGLAGGVAHVRLESGSGLAWQMTYLACPAVATVSEVSQAMALGVSQQYSLPPELLHAALAVANELDASADFNALCYEDASSGNLLLRGHVTIR